MSYVLRLTPNGVSAISACFTFAALAVLVVSRPSLSVGLAVGFGLTIGYAFDSADGQLARLRGGGSPSGEWLDHIIDATKISTLHLAVLISIYRYFDLSNPSWMLVPIAYSIINSVMFFGMILIDQIRRNQPGPSSHAIPDSGEARLRSWLVLPTDYGLLCLVFFLLGWPAGFFGAYTFLLAWNAVFLILALAKWFRETRALGAPQRRGS